MSKSPATVSVALCTFNGERFVLEQLSSICNQTRLAEEIIICDDGSKDGTADIIREFAKRSPIPIHFHQNSSQLRVTKNFEEAISFCKGDVLFLCDQDDVWQPTKVESLLDALVDDSVGLAFSDADIVHEDLSPAGYRLWQSIWFDARERRMVNEGEALSVLLKHAVAAGSTLAFKSKYLPLILPIPDFPHSHDIWITLLIGAVAKIRPISEPLIQYRLHDSNQVGMKKYGLLGQLKMARKQIESNAFLYAADFHSSALDRLKHSSKPVSPHDLELLQEKVNHSKRRHELPRWPWSRWPVIASELFRGNYSKYSYGFKSVLQDLVLR